MAETRPSELKDLVHAIDAAEFIELARRLR